MPAIIRPATERRARVGKAFILAGDARFTIAKPDGSHRTYRVRYKETNGKWDEMWFVSLLTGNDNDADGSYTYVGILDDFTGQVRLTAKSPYPLDSGPVHLLNRVLARVWADDHEAYEQHGYKLHHEGRCGRCGRVLTVPESVESGFGPECIKLVDGPRWNTQPMSPERAQESDPLCYEASDSDCPNYGGFQPEYDPSGEEVVAWRGRVNGREVIVYND